MVSDNQRPTDQLKPKLSGEYAGKTKDNLEQLTERLETKEFMPPEQFCIVDVSVADLPMPEEISGSEDFIKYSADTLQSGIEKLEEMKQVIDKGNGKDTDYWAAYDAAQGLDMPNGYQIVYDSYYGNDHIRVEHDGDQYHIINGRHRIWLAKQMGVESLPMEVVEVSHDR